MPSRTNLGPLTTPFTYPSSCAIAVHDCSTCDDFWQAQTCTDNGFNSQGVQDNIDCWPSRANTDLSTGVALNGWGFYSPGLSCPVGYTTACGATASVESGFTFQYPLTAGETAIGCCPPGFTCNYEPGGAQTCISAGTTGSFAAVTCSSGTSDGFNYFNVPETTAVTESGGATTTAFISTVAVYAPLFQLLYQSSDVSQAQQTSASISIGLNGGSTSSSSSSTGSSGLSVGARAGIGVGVAIAVLVILAAIIAFGIRKRKQKQNASYVNEIMTFEPRPQPGGGGPEAQAAYYPYQTDQCQPTEYSHQIGRSLQTDNTPLTDLSHHSSRSPYSPYNQQHQEDYTQVVEMGSAMPHSELPS
ncbi:hypothetical protein F5Y16DRAFT_397571 [Xylariaceae sp. FL0255]|nr:hypothetical protein F5Y16DRAFT_397571 [Xylariaceae sp. FL0255]